ncbi:uncharacterized protein LOC132379560 isoform X2 [Hypanus sabinus]|uniref:uncharacterized protein LOC132379560 isoform X2 n=1 Tax=Hypanus sabinus TaxID=79690 RepID=UPI0028C3B0C5|nr:uncharacterized protein LOC132379560 isoform X2 [Hypanus sabinus]
MLLVTSSTYQDLFEFFSIMLLKRFNLLQYEIPNYFKQASIIPISKKNMATYLNHPVALISSVTKCFVRLVMKHINCCLRNYLDLFQFADHQNGSTVDGSISLVLHSALEYLDHEDTHIRILFIEYRSVFIPSKLITKYQGLGPHFPHWQTLKAKESKATEEQESFNEYTDDDVEEPPKLPVPPDRAIIEDIAKKRIALTCSQQKKPIVIPKLSPNMLITADSNCSE